ncbi:MAG TPA: chemotaxis protein CheW, partial [Pseudomonadales bacterium]|nr:chemotaxis protein CheW [Pseudomonadales bacterium]
MAGVMDSVNQRTQLVGKNRLELLLFRLAGKQLYGINVFKVKEVLPSPRLNLLPHTNPVVKGVAHIRGATVPVIDLGFAIGMGGVKDQSKAFVIMTEYNGRTQGFLVDAVERIVNTNWEDIHAPPAGAGKHNFLTAVTEFEKKMVEIIDVELVLAKVSPLRESISAGLIDERTSQA